MTTAQRTKTREHTESTSQSRLDNASQVGIGIMGGISALIGLWAVACLVSAMIGSGGLLNLTRSWFQAVTGM